jgi:hypothetical protein
MASKSMPNFLFLSRVLLHGLHEPFFSLSVDPQARHGVFSVASLTLSRLLQLRQYPADDKSVEPQRVHVFLSAYHAARYALLHGAQRPAWSRSMAPHFWHGFPATLDPFSARHLAQYPHAPRSVFPHFGQADRRADDSRRFRALHAEHRPSA